MRYDSRHVARHQTERSPMKKLLTVLIVVSALVAPAVLCAANKSKPKRKWPSRPLRGMTKWPRGRKIRSRR